MNSKSRYFSSLLIATVAAFGYYILTDFNINNIQLKTFSSLGIPFKMYQTNNSVKQKKLPLPKVVFVYTVQQDELKAPQIDLIAEGTTEADEFLAGLTMGVMDELKRTSDKKQQGKISDVSQYGMKESGSEIPTMNKVPFELPPNPNKKECTPTYSVQPQITAEDIEMFVNTVSTQNVKKIEECFKKIKVIYGNENAGLKNVIVNSVQNPNKQTRTTCTTSTCTTTCPLDNKRMRKATPVASSEDEEVSEDEDSDE